jgi:CubicO group peptidase (beta-lactamase class C family)
MPKRYRDPEAPEVLETVLDRIRGMTREEWVQELAWRPQGVEETWRMQSLPAAECLENAPKVATETDGGDPSAPDSVATAVSPQAAHR